MPIRDLKEKREYDRRWREQNRSKCRAAQKRYRERNLDKVKAMNRRCREQSRDKRNECLRNRRSIDFDFKLRENFRSRLYYVVKNKAGSAVDDLGCSIAEFRLYIENQFEEGMTWDNYGKVWELDHVIPLCEFDLSNRMEFLEACNWLNIRPLSCSENRSRSKRIRNNRLPVGDEPL